MSECNNPVARLVEFLEAALSLRVDQPACDAWATLFGCEPSNTLSIARGLIELSELVDACESALEENVKGDPALYLSPLKNIRIMVSSFPWNQGWGSCRGQIDSNTLQGLKFGDHTLQHAYPSADKEIQAKVYGFIDELEALLSECLKSDLSDELKQLFMKHLEAIRTGLLDFLAGKPNKIENLTDVAVGAFARNLPAIENSSTESKGIAKRIIAQFTFANQILSKTHEMMTLASPVIEKLLPLIH